MLEQEMREHLQTKLLPFWKGLIDEERGGYYGYMSFDLQVERKAEKGCILNSRILWFFSTAARLLEDPALIPYADHAWTFLRDHFADAQEGGVYWSVRADGTPLDTSKHTYCQAFAIYGLAACYELTGNPESLSLALSLVEVIESRCRDEGGYLEAFDRSFQPASNEKLSENGVMAGRTMNTLLHVLEAYTELYRVCPLDDVAGRIREMLDLFADRVYEPAHHRLGVFFDREWNSLIDLTSYGHDIEAAWLIDRATGVLGDERYVRRMSPITEDLARQVLAEDFDGHSLPQECERGVVNTDRVWWVQAETVNGFLNAWQRTGEEAFLMAARAEWKYIQEHLVDPRAGGEWYWLLDAQGRPYRGRPEVEPWKCPYHNGRMCLEVIRRGLDV